MKVRLEVIVAKRRYVIVVEQGEHNWGAFAPDVWGCVATGATREEAERSLREALEFHFRSMAEDGDPITAPGKWMSTVEVEVPDNALSHAS